MNERIQQLAEQARIKDHWSIDEGRYLTNYLDEKKFAQLIVAECMKLNSKELSITAIERLLPMYREHFGVEE